ncbi:MAG: PKD-like family lipoprotein [Mucinivorans sp.]
MRKNLIKIVSIIVLALSLNSCYKDLGNYDYNWIDRVVVYGMGDKYSVMRGDSLKIAMEVYASKTTTEELTELGEGYSYAWIALTNSYLIPNPIADTISREKDLGKEISLNKGEYVLEFVVRDNINNLEWKYKSALSVTLSILEGWLFMEKDAQGYADLDILSRNTDGEYRMYNHMLSSTTLTKEQRGGARSVCFLNGQLNKGKGIWFLTDNITGYLDVETGHLFDKKQVMGNFMTEQTPDNYTIKKMIQLPLNNVFVFTDNNDMRFSTQAILLLSDELCYYRGEKFDISPVVGATFAFTASQFLCYDNTNKRFLLFRSNYNWTTLPNLPKGKELINMSSLGASMSETAYALLKDDAGMYEIVLNPNDGSVVSPMKLMGSGPNLMNAEFYAYHQSSYVLYYSHQSKLFVNRSGVETPVSLTTSEGKSINLEGEITCLFTRNFGNTHIYPHLIEYLNYLVVATKLPDGTGKVYFLTPEYGNAHKMTVTRETPTPNPIISIDYQTNF